ncbi:DUF1254 domain-containing protein [Streptomyces sp. NPDC055078]
MTEPALAQTVRTAAEAWLYAHPMLENYRTLRAEIARGGGFGRFRHHREPFTPADTDWVTPNNDTPYSWAWLDLRTEPWVLSVPATDRYYLLPFHDLDTTYIGYIGTRTTGPEAGDHLIAGPGWEHGRPVEADRVANWLPAPDGPFAAVLRLYGPDRSVLDGTWRLPDLVSHDRPVHTKEKQ